MPKSAQMRRVRARAQNAREAKSGQSTTKWPECRKVPECQKVPKVPESAESGFSDKFDQRDIRVKLAQKC